MYRVNFPARRVFSYAGMDVKGDQYFVIFTVHIMSSLNVYQRLVTDRCWYVVSSADNHPHADKKVT